MKASWVLSVCALWYLPKWMFSRAESAEQQQQEERCDARLWYVDMLRAGALLGQLSAEQRRVRAAVETLLSQPGSAGDAVLCETLRMYERVLRPAATTQDDETEPAVEETITDETGPDDFVTASPPPFQASEDYMFSRRFEAAGETQPGSGPDDPTEQNDGDDDFVDDANPTDKNLDILRGGQDETVLAEEADWKANPDFETEDRAEQGKERAHLPDMQNLSDRRSETTDEEKVTNIQISDEIQRKVPERVENFDKEMLSILHAPYFVERSSSVHLESEAFGSETDPSEAADCGTSEDVEDDALHTTNGDNEERGEFLSNVFVEAVNTEPENLEKHVEQEKTGSVEGNDPTEDVAMNEPSLDNEVLSSTEGDTCESSTHPTNLVERSERHEAAAERAHPLAGAWLGFKFPMCLQEEACDVFEYLVFPGQFRKLHTSVSDTRNIDETEDIVQFTEHTTDVSVPSGEVNKKKEGFVSHLDAQGGDPAGSSTLSGGGSAEFPRMLQTIELQLLKLENRLLTETLNKQNNSAIFAKLENLILNLENELLKMNRSFVALQEENTELRFNQLSEKRVYDIVQQVKLDTTGEVDPKASAESSNALETAVDQQQTKIVELIFMMHNQTNFVNKLEEKSQSLEEQNKELHQVLVNQSNMMSELVTSIKSMKEEQEKLKSKVTHPQPLTVQDERFLPQSAPSSDELSPPREQPVFTVDSGDKRGEEIQSTPGAVNSNLVSSASDETTLLDTILHNKELSPDEKLQLLRDARLQAQTQNSALHSMGAESPNPVKAMDLPSGESESGKKVVNVDNGASVKQAKKTGATGSTKTNAATQPSSGSTSSRSTVRIPETPKYFTSGSHDPKDCYDHLVSGKRRRDSAMRVSVGPAGRHLQVFCDLRGGGWTLVMRRTDGSQDFYQDWDKYKHGFGGVLGEHWIGNEVLHLLTNQKNYRLRVEMTDWERNTAWAEYDYFMVDDESESYRLHVTGFRNDSTAGDGLLKHNGMKFSTWDVDNDLAGKDFGGSCAKRFHGAWWYFKCYKSNLTGRYYRDGRITDGMYDGVSWKAWRPSTVSLKKVEMKIMPRNVQKVN